MNNAPVKPESVESTENVALFIVGSNLEVLSVVDINVSVLRLDAQLVDKAQLYLGTQDLARVFVLCRNPDQSFRFLV